MEINNFNFVARLLTVYSVLTQSMYQLVVCFSGCQVHHYAVVRHAQGFRIDVKDMVS